MRFALHGAGSEIVFPSADTDLIIFKYGTGTKSLLVSHLKISLFFSCMRITGIQIQIYIYLIKQTSDSIL